MQYERGQRVIVDTDTGQEGATVMACHDNALDLTFDDGTVRYRVPMSACSPAPGERPYTGGPAFPTGDHPESRLYAESGMSLRDYHAAKAMQAAVSGHFAHHGVDSNYWAPEDIAEYAYQVADAMLKAREA